MGAPENESRAPLQLTSGQLGTNIANAVVSLYAQWVGRGPTRARTVLGHNFVAVVLQDTLTVGERRLVEVGAGASVVSTRRTFQQTMKNDLVAAVESATGRVVGAFFSDQTVHPDMAVEVFVLEPEDVPAVP